MTSSACRLVFSTGSARLSRSCFLQTSRLNSTDASDGRPDKASLFFHPEVQSRLHRLTGMDYSKVFRVSKLGKRIGAPSYSFLTQSELEKLQNKAKERAAVKLQMPPVLEPRSDETEVLEVDTAIQGWDAAPIVFTDITFGVHDRDRIIVVREPDGTLRHAKPEQRDRLNQIYFPHEGRKVVTPAMFKEQNLEPLLKEKKYLHILDRNCAQFEPDHPDYIRVAEDVYDHVDLSGDWDVLWSTRHYGPMVFHLVWQQKVDDLISHFLQSPAKANRMEAIHDVLRLYVRFHPKSKLSENATQSDDSDSREDVIKMLRKFISLESRKSHKLKGALENMLEAEEANRKVAGNMS